MVGLVGPHHLPPLGGTDGPVPEVTQAGQVGARLGQGGDREEGERDHQETLLAGGKGDDQSAQFSQRVHSQDVCQTCVSQVAVPRHCDGLQGPPPPQDGVEGRAGGEGAVLHPGGVAHTAGGPGQVSEGGVAHQEQVDLPQAGEHPPLLLLALAGAQLLPGLGQSEPGVDNTEILKVGTVQADHINIYIKVDSLYLQAHQLASYQAHCVCQE